MADGVIVKKLIFLTRWQEILLDHLSYPHGPRVRDRLSHGETAWDMFPWQLTNNMATITIYLATMFVDINDHHVSVRCLCLFLV